MTTPRQPDLFGAAPEPPGAAHAAPPATAPGTLLIMPGPAAKLSKPQRDFNRLTRRLQQLRDHVAAWQAAADAARVRHVQEVQPLSRELVAAQRDMVLWTDAFLQAPPPGERLTKAGRAKLVALLRQLAQAVLDSGPDEAVEAAHDRHSRQSWRAQQREQADLLATAFGTMVGDEALFEGEADSVDELLQRAAQRLHQKVQDKANAAAEPAQAPDAAAARPGRGEARAARAQAREAQALREVSQSVREVYRRLAAALHPDREPDADERRRKTTLMARANQAYEAKDLLTLLTLQLELEHIDASHLAGLDDRRLRHFNQVLQEQVDPLESELAMLQMTAAEVFEQAPGLLAWPPRMAGAAVDQLLQDLASALRHLRRDVPQLQDPATRPATLRQLQVSDPDDEPDMAEMVMMEALMVGRPTGPGSSKGRRRR